MINQTLFLKKIRFLKPALRNKVRAVASGGQDSKRLSTLNKLRHNCSPKEVVQIETVLSFYDTDSPIIVVPFPKTPQTFDSIIRLSPLSLSKNLQILDEYVYKYRNKLEEFLTEVNQLNYKILNRDFRGCNEQVKVILKNYGYSNFLLRKCAVIKHFASDSEEIPDVNYFLDEAGAKRNNLIVNSLLNSFRREQDYLWLKKSILSLQSKGYFSKFEKDICRSLFHPYTESKEEFSELIQSNFQSSLIDAILICKINQHLIDFENQSNLYKILQEVSNVAPDLNEIASIYVGFEDSEDVFMVQACAWIENDELIEVRLLFDNFFDARDASYVSRSGNVVSRLKGLVVVDALSELVHSRKLICTSSHLLDDFIFENYFIRSAVFNYLNHVKNGAVYIDESDLLDLMGKTTALSRTIDISAIKQLIKQVPTELSKLILHLLVGNKSEEDLDKFALRRALQNILLKEFGGEVMPLVIEFQEKNPVIADYMYTLFNEDFLAQLPRCIKNASDVIKTRVQLHKWKASITGDELYNQRANSLILEQKINRVRGELNDNRIYVDVRKFSEWVNDNLTHKLDIVLSLLERNNALDQYDNPEIRFHLEHAFNEFCKNEFFGIASYIGRRIRHGTFRGHLYSNVVNIENNYLNLISNPFVMKRWDEWKSAYENKVMSIISKKIHIWSSKARDGFLIPNLDHPEKNEIALHFAHDLIDEFKSQGHIFGAPDLLVEYCWRLAEVDLRSFNNYIKKEKINLLEFGSLESIKSIQGIDEESKEFLREIHCAISDRMTSVSAWFKRPPNVSPKTSLGLLYKAVVCEVQDTFHNFSPNTTFDEKTDVEIMGAANHIYDALYVIVFNAAKHGKIDGQLEYKYSVVMDVKPKLKIKIRSEIRDEDDENHVCQQLMVNPNENVDDAQTFENRSGIKKLYHLQKYDEKFVIDNLSCENRFVEIAFSYTLES